MPKPIIAVDIDDVLAAHAEGMVAFSNETWGTRLSVEDYDEHWAKMWQVDEDEVKRRSEIFHASGIVLEYSHNTDAVSVLSRLRAAYRLVVITSRRRIIECETRTWLDKHFPETFDEVYFAGFWDNATIGAHMLTKAQLARDLHASFLIDDQIKHCFAAAEAGVQALLFGNYGWNATETIPQNVTRVANWPGVAEYFDV